LKLTKAEITHYGACKMTVIIDDRYKNEALEALSTTIPKEAYTIKTDPLREELKRRIEEIDSGKVEMIPFDDFWDRIEHRVEEFKNAN